jgi:hypothetical protein
MSEELAVYETGQVVGVGASQMQPTAFEMMIALSGKGIKPEEIEKMMTIIERQDDRQAEKAFVSSLAEFKENPPVITRDKKNLQYNSKYCSLENLVYCVASRLSECGLSHRWDIAQEGQAITVKCSLTHSMGHSVFVEMSAPPDVSGKKNPIQQMKSTITYLKAVTLESILGVASTDANHSDDGNGFKQVAYISGNKLSEIIDLMAAKITNRDDYLIYAINTHKVKSWDEIPESSYQAMRAELASMEDLA